MRNGKKEEKERNENYNIYYEYLTFDEFFGYDVLEYETFENSFTTEAGDTVIAFGYYGHDY